MLHKLKMFDGLTAVEQARYLGKMEKKTVLKNTIIFNKDEHGDWMYILINGHIEVTSESLQGDNQTLGVINVWESFGEMALLTGEARSATTKAVTDVELYIIH